MSSKKPYLVEASLVLIYELQIHANNEDEASERAHDRLKLIAEASTYPHEDIETNVNTIRRADL